MSPHRLVGWRITQSDALRLDFVLQPGDIQLLSNFVMLHTRTQYEDYPVRAQAHPSLTSLTMSVGISITSSSFDS